MISQNPMSSLNPVFTIRNQMAEAIAGRKKLPVSEVNNIIVKMLNRVHIKEAKRRSNLYPTSFRRYAAAGYDLHGAYQSTRSSYCR